MGAQRPLLYRILGPSCLSGDRCAPTYTIPIEAPWDTYRRGLSLTCVVEVTSISKYYAALELWLTRDAESEEDPTEGSAALPGDSQISSQGYKLTCLDDWQDDDSLFSTSAPPVLPPNTKLLLNARWRLVIDVSVTPMRLLVAFRVPILFLAPLHLSLRCEGEASCRLILAEVHQKNILHLPVVYQVEWHNGSAVTFAADEKTSGRPSLPSKSAISPLAIESLRSGFTELFGFLNNTGRLKLCLLSKGLYHEWLAFCQRQFRGTLDLFADVGMRLPPPLSVCLLPTPQPWFTRLKSARVPPSCARFCRWLTSLEDSLISYPDEAEEDEEEEETSTETCRWGRQLVQTTLPLEERARMHTLQEGTQTRFQVKYQSSQFVTKEVIFVSSGPLIMSWSPESARSPYCVNHIVRGPRPSTLLSQTSPMLCQD